jgi:thiol-disulfide isomerase/thioredoxin
MSRHILVAIPIALLVIGCGLEKGGTPGKSSNTPAVEAPPPREPIPPPPGEKATPPATAKTAPADLLAKAQQAMGHQDLAGAGAALDELLKADPKNRQGLFLLAQVLQRQAMQLSQGGNPKAATDLFLKSAKCMKELRAGYPKLTDNELAFLPMAIYNEACAESLAGHTDKAIAALEDAMDSGFTDLEHIKKDTDFDPIRNSPQFQKVLKDAPAKLQARAQRHARELLDGQQSFAFDFSLPNVQGKTVALKDFAGKVLIADIWGTWCPPCRKEIPHFVELHKRYQKAGLEIVGLNYENESGDKAKELITEFVKTNKVPYQCLIGDDKTRAQVPNFEGYPTTLFIDRTGKVRLKLVSYHSLTDLEAIVTALLGEKSTASAKR